MDIASLFTAPTAPTGATVGLGTAAGDTTAASGSEAVESFNRLLKSFLENSSTNGGIGPTLRAGSEKTAIARSGDPAETMIASPEDRETDGISLPTDAAASPELVRPSTAEMRWQQAGLNLLAMGEANEAAPALSDEVTSFLNDLSSLMRQQGVFTGKATLKNSQGGAATATKPDAAITLASGTASAVLETVATAVTTTTMVSLRPGATVSANGPKLAAGPQQGASSPLEITVEQVAVDSMAQWAGTPVAGASGVKDTPSPSSRPAKVGESVKAGDPDPVLGTPVTPDNGLMALPSAALMAAVTTTIGNAPAGVSNDPVPLAAGKADTAPGALAVPAPVPMPTIDGSGQEKPALQAERPLSAPGPTLPTAPLATAPAMAGVNGTGAAATSRQEIPQGQPLAPPSTGTITTPPVISGPQQPVTLPDATGSAPATIAPTAAKTVLQDAASASGAAQATNPSVQVTAIPGEQEEPAPHPEMAAATFVATPPPLPMGQPDNTARAPEPSVTMPARQNESLVSRTDTTPAANMTRPAMAAAIQERPQVQSDRGGPTGEATVPGVITPASGNDPAVDKITTTTDAPAEAAPAATPAKLLAGTQAVPAAPAGRIILPAGMQPVAPGDPAAATALAAAQRTPPAPVQSPVPSTGPNMGTAPSPLPADVKTGRFSAVAQTLTASMTGATSGQASSNGGPIIAAVSTPPANGMADPAAPVAMAVPVGSTSRVESAPRAMAGASAAPVAVTPMTAAPTPGSATPLAVPSQMTGQQTALDQPASAPIMADTQPAVTITVQKTGNGKPGTIQLDANRPSAAGPMGGPGPTSAVSAAQALTGEAEMPVPVPTATAGQPTAKPFIIAPAPEATAADLPTLSAISLAPDDAAAAPATTTAAPATGLNRPLSTARQQTATSANRQQVEAGAGQATQGAAVTDKDSPVTDKAEIKEGNRQRRMLAPQHTDPDAMTRPAMEAAAERPQQASPRPTSASPITAGAADTLLARAVGDAGASTGGGELGAEQQGAEGHSSALSAEESSLNAAVDSSKIGTTDFSQHLRQATAPGAAHRAGSNPPVTYQVAVQMQRATQEGHDRISIQLRPHDMGRVDVQLEFNNDGKLRAKVTADSVQTLELLQKDSRNLENALREAGLSTDQNSLSFSLRDDGDQAQRQQQERQQGQKSGTRFASEKAEEETPATPAYRPVLGPGRVDVRI